MAEVRVTKQFKDDFDTWANDRLAFKDFTEEEMADLKVLLRKDFQPGPDQIRDGLECLNAAGVAVPATIDDHEERFRMWSSYFAQEAQEIRSRRKYGNAS